MCWSLLGWLSGRDFMSMTDPHHTPSPVNHQTRRRRSELTIDTHWSAKGPVTSQPAQRALQTSSRNSVSCSLTHIGRENRMICPHSPPLPRSNPIPLVDSKIKRIPRAPALSIVEVHHALGIRNYFLKPQNFYLLEFRDAISAARQR